MQILPAIDLRGGRCVRLRQGDYNQETVFSDDPVEMARRWADDGAQWLHLVDLDGAREGRPVNHEVVKDIVSATGLACELGGGIRNEDAIRLMLGIDARDSMVATEGWLDVSQTSAIDLASEYRDLNLAALIYTNIANDGMMQGIDDGTIEDLKRLAGLGFDVIASGGVTTLDDVRRIQTAAQAEPGINGIIIGRAIYEGTIAVREVVELVSSGSN